METLEQKEEYRLLMDTAVLAGEIMLSCGAETYRVEDTVWRILNNSGLRTVEAFVIRTGLAATLADPSIDAITVVKRVSTSDTDLNKICLVNEISRQLCSSQLPVEEAYERLVNMSKKQYSQPLRCMCTVLVATGFTMLLGGTLTDTLLAGVDGVLLVCIMLLCKWMHINSFISTIAESIAIAAGAVLFRYCFGAGMVNMDLIIIGSIMPLAPGVAITNAIRDTLQGDYISGGARALEAFMIAAAIATGVGVGMSMFKGLSGGIFL